MTNTRSATPLDRISIEPRPGGVSDVWLRRGITEIVDDTGNAAWEADELHFVTPGIPTTAQVEAAFAELWAVRSLDQLTDREYTTQAVAEITAALAELGDIVAGGE